MNSRKSAQIWKKHIMNLRNVRGLKNVHEFEKYSWIQKMFMNLKKKMFTSFIKCPLNLVNCSLGQKKFMNFKKYSSIWKMFTGFKNTFASLKKSFMKLHSKTC